MKRDLSVKINFHIKAYSISAKLSQPHKRKPGILEQRQDRRHQLRHKKHNYMNIQRIMILLKHEFSQIIMMLK